MTFILRYTNLTTHIIDFLFKQNSLCIILVVVTYVTRTRKTPSDLLWSMKSKLLRMFAVSERMCVMLICLLTFVTISSENNTAVQWRNGINWKHFWPKWLIDVTKTEMMSDPKLTDWWDVAKNIRSFAIQYYSQSPLTSIASNQS